MTSEVDEMFDAALSKRSTVSVPKGKSASDAKSAHLTGVKSKKSDSKEHPTSDKPAAKKAHAEVSTAQVEDEEDISDVRGDKKKVRALTEDGLPIYTWQEMRMGEGGDTPDCPFDCKCCY